LAGVEKLRSSPTLLLIIFCDAPRSSLLQVMEIRARQTGELNAAAAA
jgi:hypothetical protein